MKRLLRISVLALACCAACTALARPRLAFHAYAVRDLCEKDFPSVLKAAKEMGFKGSEEVVNDWLLLVNVLNHAAEVCAKHGIAVSYHNHAHEFQIRLGGMTALSGSSSSRLPIPKRSPT